MGKRNNIKRLKILKKFIKPGTVGLEIGVFAADLTVSIFENIEGVKIYALDPWEVQKEYKGRLYGGGYDMNDIYETVKTKLKDRNVEIIRDYSDNVQNHIVEKLDWAYIDGNHSYKYVLNDLENTKLLLKEDGIIMCDDYGWVDKYSGGGVTKAVTEFCKKNKLKNTIIGNQAIIFLK